MSKKVFISQIMRNEKPEDIVLIRENIKKEFLNSFGDSFEFIDSYNPELKHKGLAEALSFSLAKLNDADIVLCPDSLCLAEPSFNNVSGCVIELSTSLKMKKTVIRYIVYATKEVYFTSFERKR
jgi:hypothetical protein